MPRISILAGLLLLTWPALAAEPAKPRAYPDLQTFQAQQDMIALGQAENECAIYTTYLVALEALNDTSNSNPSHTWDYINYGGGSYGIRPAEGSFRAARVDFLYGPLHWTGPYISNFPSIQTGTTPYDQGSPLDPWGTPYYFFSPLGLIRGDTGKVTLELYGDDFGQTTGQYTIVSLGPDGIKSSDDLAYSLGFSVSATVLTSLRGPGVTPDTSSPSGKIGKSLASLTNSYESSFHAEAGATVTLRGQNLGAADPNAKVTFNGQALDTVTSWTARAITFTLPAGLGGQSGALAIQRGTGSSNGLNVTINAPPPAAARGWGGYE